MNGTAPTERRVVAAAGLAILAVGAAVVGFVGTLALFYTASVEVYYLIYGDHVIAGVATLVFLASVALLRSGRAVPRWVRTSLLGISVGAWIAAFLNGGSVSV